MFGGFGGAFIAERAGFKLSKNLRDGQLSLSEGYESLILLSRSMAHCSKSSRVISAVGGFS